MATLTFRQLHRPGQPLVAPNPWDVGSAVLLTGAGFTALATTSSGVAFGLGRPDGSLRRDESLGVHRAMCDATTVPVSADLEGGFGHTPEEVADTVTRAVEIGLAGCSIEDHTGDPADPLYPPSLATERVAAAVEAARRADPEFVLTARFEGLLWTDADLDAAIAALVAYEAAGADVLFAPGLTEVADIATLCESVEAPVSVGLEMARPPSVAELADAGVARITVGARFVRLAYGALLDAAAELRDLGTFASTSGLIPYEELEAHFDG